MTDYDAYEYNIDKRVITLIIITRIIGEFWRIRK